MPMRPRSRTTTNIQGAGQSELAAMLSQMMGAQQGFDQAPDMQSIMQAFQGPNAQDKQLAHDASFGGLAQGLRPQLEQALGQARSSANSRGMSGSTINAALQAQAVPQVMSPALAGAQQNYSQLLTQLPFQRGAAMMQGRGMAFQQLQATLARQLQERSMNSTTTQYKSGSNIFGKLAGLAVGGLLSGFTGGAGAGLAKLGKGIFGGGDPNSSTGSPETQAAQGSPGGFGYGGQGPTSSSYGNTGGGYGGFMQGFQQDMGMGLFDPNK